MATIYVTFIYRMKTFADENTIILFISEFVKDKKPEKFVYIFIKKQILNNNESYIEYWDWDSEKYSGTRDESQNKKILI